MNKNFITGGCSFTLGNELSDVVDGTTPSKRSWSYQLMRNNTKVVHDDYICTAKGGAGNSAIARRVFNAVANTKDISCVVVMWSFLSRYDWAMPRHKNLENTSTIDLNNFIPIFGTTGSEGFSDETPSVIVNFPFSLI